MESKNQLERAEERRKELAGGAQASFIGTIHKGLERSKERS